MSETYSKRVNDLFEELKTTYGLADISDGQPILTVQQELDITLNRRWSFDMGLDADLPRVLEIARSGILSAIWRAVNLSVSLPRTRCSKILMEYPPLKDLLDTLLAWSNATEDAPFSFLCRLRKPRVMIVANCLTVSFFSVAIFYGVSSQGTCEEQREHLWDILCALYG